MLCTIENFESPAAMAGRRLCGAVGGGDREYEREIKYKTVGSKTPLLLCGFLSETCEEAKLLEREIKTAYKHGSPRPITCRA